MKLFKIAYNIFMAGVAIVALLLVFSIFPITGNYKVMIVLSGSMEPAVKTGSLIVAKPSHSAGSGQADYKVGEIIAFGENGKSETSTTHRIVEVKGEGENISYTTKGDVNNAPDPERVLPEAIIGKVLFSVPVAGYIVNATKQPLGFVLIIIIPATIIIYDECRNIGKEIKKMRSKKKEKRPEPEGEKKIPPSPRKIV